MHIFASSACIHANTRRKLCDERRWVVAWLLVIERSTAINLSALNACFITYYFNQVQRQSRLFAFDAILFHPVAGWGPAFGISKCLDAYLAVAAYVTLRVTLLRTWHTSSSSLTLYFYLSFSQMRDEPWRFRTGECQDNKLLVPDILTDKNIFSL